MVVNTPELFSGIAILADETNMRVTMKQSAKGALLCGGACFVGGLLAGPVGLAIGGTVGGVSAWRMSQGKFKPVREVIMKDLTERQREKLLEHIMTSVRDIQITDVAILLPMIMNSASIQQTVMNTVVSFIGNKLSLAVDGTT